MLRFRLACRGRNDETTYLPVTVYVQDINDNAPVFQSEGKIYISFFEGIFRDEKGTNQT